MGEAPLWAVLLATAPVVLLAVLVVGSRPLTPSAWLTSAVAAGLALTVFGLSPVGLGIAVVRGLWTGGWILLIVLPALLLFEVMERSGALASLSTAAEAIAPSEGRRLLLLAWVLPSFLQGAAGFGSPIAITAPMLVRTGLTPAAAVAACLVGYQWSVTFGSMGSSFFMASATARLAPGAAAEFALRTAMLLAVNCVLSGLIVLSRSRTERRHDVATALTLGVVMAAAMTLTVMAEPALGATVAGLAGLLAAWWLLPRRHAAARPGVARLLADALPYIVLTGLITVGLGVGPIAAQLGRVPAVAPVLPGATAAFGHVTAPAPVTPRFEPLQHPVAFLVVAAAVAVVAYRLQGRWPRRATRAALGGWAQRSGPVVASILGLTVLAAVMVEAGMLDALAGALADLLGHGFVVVAALLGAFGTVLTGSTTASNALFAALQAGVAERLEVAAPVLLAAQTAGGNVGNALSPALIAVGAAAAGAHGDEGAILRRNLPASGLLLTATIAAVVVQALLA